MRRGRSKLSALDSLKNTSCNTMRGGPFKNFHTQIKVLSLFSSVVQSYPTLCDPMDCSTQVPVHHQLPELAQTQVHRVGDAIQPSHPLLSLSPPAFNLSQHWGLFQSQLFASGGPKCWSFSFSISPSNEYSGLISFSRDWLDLLAVQGTLKSLLQYHSSKASILQRSAFLTVQLSHPYRTTGKTKVMSLFFNMLSRLVITFLSRSKCLLISWLQSPSDFGAPQNKVCHCFHCFPIYLP